LAQLLSLLKIRQNHQDPILIKIHQEEEEMGIKTEEDTIKQMRYGEIMKLRKLKIKNNWKKKNKLKLKKKWLNLRESLRINHMQKRLKNQSQSRPKKKSMLKQQLNLLNRANKK
jgi:hypothetical protein